ncbi:MAG: pyridoxal phosphate-dependent aminotransferase [Pseudomonadota bacterium]
MQNVIPGGDDGWGVFLRARALRAARHDIVELTIGEHDIPTDPAILDAMDRAARAGAVGYAPVPGTPELREAVADWVTKRGGVPTSAREVLIVPGGQAGLFAAHLCALDPGQSGLFPDPFYATYPGTVRAAGGRPVPVATAASAGFVPTAEAILATAGAAEAAGNAAGSLLINTPNNPTGAVYDAAALDAIMAAAALAGLWVISDEVYDGQVWEGRHVSARAAPGARDRTLVVGSMSKSFAMTGSRLGWIVGPEAAIASLSDLATHTTYGVPGFIQAAALWALTEGGAALEARVAAPFARRRAQVTAVLGACAALSVLPMRGGMYAFVDIRATGLSGTAFANALLDDAQIAVMPGESFGASGAGHVRVALTAPDRVFEQALHGIAAFADRHAARAQAP